MLTMFSNPLIGILVGIAFTAVLQSASATVGVLKLTKHEMNTAQTRQASLYLHTINDFERIGDHASYIAYMSSDMHDNHTHFSQEAWDELNVVMEAVREEINIT